MIISLISIVLAAALKDDDVCSEKTSYYEVSSTYKYTLSDLPYTEDFLEPQISEQIVYLHHEKHQQTYVDKLNKYLEEQHPEWESLSLVSLLEKHGDDTSIQKYGGGVYNHDLYWWTLTNSVCSSEPDGDLLDAIEAVWGDFATFQTAFNTTATTVFGSGWTWLCVDTNGELNITTTPNQINPLMSAANHTCLPILGLDCWEHAYYLDYLWLRGEYYDAWWQIIDWNTVSLFYEEYASKGVAVSLLQS